MRLGSILFAMSLVGCSASVDAPPPAAASRPDGARFELAVDAPARAISGRSSAARFTIQPVAPWHISTDYAPRLDLRAVQGVEIESRGHGHADSVRFDEDELALELPFVARGAGKRRMSGELRFAVCGEGSCAPESVPVDFTVDVGCDTGTLC